METPPLATPTPTTPTAEETPTAFEQSPILRLRRAVRRQQAQARDPRQDLVWRPRFAYTSALVILGALTVVTMPLWIVLYRITGAPAIGEAGARVADVVALCMMLLGGYLAGAAAWVIIIEMRGRVRMVDTLARTGEREMVASPGPEMPEPQIPGPQIAVPEATQASAAAMLEASSRLLSSFSSVLRSFGQLPAQVAMLAVALALFVGATVLSLR